MKKFIKANEQYVPIVLQGRPIYEMSFVGESYSTNSPSTQFPIEKIKDVDWSYYLGYARRMNRYCFGRGFIWDYDYEDRIIAIVCEDDIVVVRQDWMQNNPTEFARFKRALKAAGYNTRKCIIPISYFADFFIDPIAPKMQDYQEEYQKQISSEFLAEEVAKLPPVEENSEEDLFFSL